MACSNIEDTIRKLASIHYDNCYEVDIQKIRSSCIANTKVEDISESIGLMVTQSLLGAFFLGENQKGRVYRCKSIPVEDWHHTYSLDTYTAKMAEILRTWQSDNKIEFDKVENPDGEFYDVWYYVVPNESMLVKDIIIWIANLERELAGHIELALKKGSISKSTLGNEKKFSLNVLLPLFRSMGYQDVQYNHGTQEFGRDIIFSETDKLGTQRNFGVQVKAGDMTGKAGSELDNLIGQIDDALKITYLDVYSRERRQITDLIIAISGKFTGNATQKICEKAHSNKVHFLDIDKIQELIAKYLGTHIE
jgi:hypothetical protein